MRPAEKAPVIGNSDCRSTPSANPVNDGTDMAATLLQMLKAIIKPDAFAFSASISYD
jgi:hypothetical protein